MGSEQKRILIVDDSDTNRAVVRLLFESEGYQVTTVASGAEALQCLQQQTVDAVVTDLNMPGMNGLALTKAIRGIPSLQQVPIVLVSGMDDEGEEHRALEHGVTVFFSKGDADFDRLVILIGDLV